jgi:hypothetical protein
MAQNNIKETLRRVERITTEGESITQKQATLLILDLIAGMYDDFKSAMQQVPLNAKKIAVLEATAKTEIARIEAEARTEIARIEAEARAQIKALAGRVNLGVGLTALAAILGIALIIASMVL